MEDSYYSLFAIIPVFLVCFLNEKVLVILTENAVRRAFLSAGGKIPRAKIGNSPLVFNQFISYIYVVNDEGG
jgi:hypothetical protein